MRSFAVAFVLILTACERESAPPPVLPTNPPEPIETSNPPAPALSEWGGGWSTDFGTLTLQQQGDQVSGAYAYTNAGVQVQGRILGAVTGNRLDFAWEESPGGAGSGHGSFTMSADGASFTGTWGQGNSTTGGGNWNGKRL